MITFRRSGCLTFPWLPEEVVHHAYNDEAPVDDFLKDALEEARKSLEEGGIPVGAVLVRDGKIIGRGHNRRVQQNDPLQHAEIDCIRNAGRIGSYAGTTLYTTLMPCYLCAGAIVQFGIDRIVVGESRTFRGAESFMKDHWVSIDDRDDKECRELMREWVEAHADLWNEDIGEL